MKKLLIVFCCAFTAVTLFCSFNPIKRGGNRFFSAGADYYEVNKTGNINIIRDLNKTTITLITCKDNSNRKRADFSD